MPPLECGGIEPISGRESESELNGRASFCSSRAINWVGQRERLLRRLEIEGSSAFVAAVATEFRARLRERTNIEAPAIRATTDRLHRAPPDQAVERTLCAEKLGRQCFIMPSGESQPGQDSCITTGTSMFRDEDKIRSVGRQLASAQRAPKEQMDGSKRRATTARRAPD